MKPYQEIDHSGDIGIEAYGPDFESLLRNLALGLMGLLARNPIDRITARRITVSSSSREELLVDWLSEILSRSASHGELYGEFQIDALDATSLRATLHGEPIDAGKHDLRFEVKAATYHSLLLEITEEGCRARVIFDL